MFRKKRGFTLIELLVVIAIIGILATIVLVSLNTARQKARDARRASDIHQIALAVEMYYDAQATAQYPVGTSYNLVYTSYLSTYLPTQPTDPTGTYAYSWLSNTSTWYCVYATGEITGPQAYYVASQRGSGKRITSAPTNSVDCIPN
jgi:prepilin-type N-terminal cleavage/methylation domain-containing protein